jgi:hypothetical protein
LPELWLLWNDYINVRVYDIDENFLVIESSMLELLLKITMSKGFSYRHLQGVTS